MKTNITYKHMEKTEAIESMILQKVKHLEKYDHNQGSHIEWVCNTNHSTHSSDVSLKLDTETYHAKAEGDNLYKTFDVIISKLENQIRKRTKK